MSYESSQRIGWQEPFHARAHAAREYLRRRWYVPVASGASVAVPSILFFVVYSYSLDEPINLRATGLVVVMGVVVAALLTMNHFLPRAIRLKKSSIFISRPRGFEWISYAKLRRCDVTSGPHPVFRGFGEGPQPLFEIFWDPRVDAEHLRALLATKGVELSTAPAQKAVPAQVRPA
jgi:hypothetical protein